MGFLDTFYQQNLPSRAVTVYLYLRERSNKDGTCFPSIPTVSRDTGLSEATVKRAIQDLTAAGWLQKEPRLRRKKERENLKKMDETEVYRYKKPPVSEETGQGAAICTC